MITKKKTSVSSYTLIGKSFIIIVNISSYLYFFSMDKGKDIFKNQLYVKSLFRPILDFGVV